jgi:post-segregation antitoxin (ccd killing protein)
MNKKPRRIRRAHQFTLSEEAYLELRRQAKARKINCSRYIEILIKEKQT